MFEVKLSQRAWVPVRLFDAANGSGSIGVAATDVSVIVVKSDTTEASYTVSVADWVEHSSSFMSGSGIYQLNLKTTDTNTSGSLIYNVKSTLSRVYVGSIKVVANEEADTFISVAVVSGALNSVSGSLRSELLTTRDVISGSLINVSASLRAEDLTTRSVLSASIVAVSSSLRTEIINNGGSSGTAILSASIVTLSSSLRSEILSNRSILSASIVNTSASLRQEELDSRDILINVHNSISGSLVLVSSSLRTEILQSKDILSGTMVNVSASLGTALSRARDVGEGSWKIFTTGPDAYKMVFYRLDSSVLFKMALTGSDGLPNFTIPFERNPTS